MGQCFGWMVALPVGQRSDEKRPHAEDAESAECGGGRDGGDVEPVRVGCRWESRLG